MAKTFQFEVQVHIVGYDVALFQTSFSDERKENVILSEIGGIIFYQALTGYTLPLPTELKTHPLIDSNAYKIGPRAPLIQF